ncbi:Rv3654c family TadE-like protein [Streptomyces sp. ALB3]|uniref:Rv3654c family TadE-like protein n=1 Tax=Streptomyces sp. ALB3 TaxID=3374278 RepID=UPI0037A32B18
MRRPGEGFQVGDRGLATVWVAITTATLCAVFAMVLALGQAVSARHRAGGAADLAALAAADQALRGAELACGAAGVVADAQGAEIVRCDVVGEIADVTARARFGPYAPEVRSRAGPPHISPPSSRAAVPSPPSSPSRAAVPSSVGGPARTRGLTPLRVSAVGPPGSLPGGLPPVPSARF